MLIRQLFTQGRVVCRQQQRYAQKYQMAIGPQTGLGLAFRDYIRGTPYIIEEFLRHASSLLMVVRSGTSLSHSRRIALLYF